jgi:hypothetical protein
MLYTRRNCFPFDLVPLLTLLNRTSLQVDGLMAQLTDLSDQHAMPEQQDDRFSQPFTPMSFFKANTRGYDVETKFHLFTVCIIFFR